MALKPPFFDEGGREGKHEGPEYRSWEDIPF